MRRRRIIAWVFVLLTGSIPGGTKVVIESPRLQYRGKPKPEKEPWKGTVNGIFLYGSQNVLVKNGAIVQGEGRSPGCHAVRMGSGCGLANVTVKVYGGGTDCVQANGTGGRINGCFLENHGSELPLPKGLFGPVGIAMPRARKWDVFDNTIVGGHVGINLSAKGNTPYEAENKIHHNRIFHTKRIHGLKAPHLIMIYSSNGNEVYENQCVTIDTRGINVQMGSVGNYIHNNLVDCRYSTVAEEGNYVENRCYGYWERSRGNPDRPNRVENNVFIVNNETTGDSSSSTFGIIVGFGGGGTRSGLVAAAEYEHNRIYCSHNDPGCKAIGLGLEQSGAGVKAVGNWVLASTYAIELSRRSQQVQVRDNIMVQSTARDGWQGIGGNSVAGNRLSGNETVALPVDSSAPDSPRDVEVVEQRGAVELRWTPSREPDTIGYLVYRDGTKISRFPGGGCFYVDLDPAEGANHKYTVTAVDVFGNESRPSVQVAAR